MPANVAVEAQVEWLRPSEVADMLRVSRQHIYRMIQRHDLEAVWVGGTPRVSRAVLEEFIRRGGVKPYQETRLSSARRRRASRVGRR